MNSQSRKIKVFIKRKFRTTFKKYFNKKDIKLLKDSNFVIVSDNCWGGAVYQWLERPYNSPFVGLWIYGDCYVKLLSNFDYYMNQKISFTNKSKYSSCEILYPIGLIEDIEIHFLHYRNENEAKIKWERRTTRMLEETNKDNYFFKICDGINTNEKMFKRFHKLPFKNKISFSIKDFSSLNFKNHYQILERDKKNKSIIPNGVKLFKLTFLYTDIIYWIKNKKIKKAS
jgi:uncharacterized protein (DUF1919 family)